MNINKNILSGIITSAIITAGLNSYAQESKTNANEDTKEKTELVKEQAQTTGQVSNTLSNANFFFGMKSADNLTDQLYLELNRGTSKNQVTYNISNYYDIELGHIVEIDNRLGYIRNIQINNKHKLAVEPMLIYYTYPHSGQDNGPDVSDAQEICLKVDYTGPIVDAKVRAGKIFGKDSGKGYMINACVSKTIELTDKLSSTLNIDGVYNAGFFVPGARGISHIEGILSVNYELIKNLNLTANGIAQKITHSDFKEVVPDQCYWEIVLSYKF